ncbi:PadR family transcriptional regulator [Shimazuella sp. AN120528]|uniref:PadR family transcriptional regulator n=1 Tax=Shimazuella soli TaxID=1892854 RepID=UPI001F107B26|nr:PadR family transcriptional regulator [Shimazuella soli]
MHHHKIIAIQERKQKEGKPDRTVYEITDVGIKTAYTWLREMLSVPKQEFSDFPAAISFLMFLTPQDVIDQFQKRANALEEILAQIKYQFSTIGEIPRLFLLEIEYQCAVIKAELEWIRSIINDIQAEKLQWDMEWLRKIATSHSKSEEL